MNVVMLSALRIGRLYSPRNIPATHFCYRLNRIHRHFTVGRIMSIRHNSDNWRLSGLQHSGSTNRATCERCFNKNVRITERKCKNFFLFSHYTSKGIECTSSTSTTEVGASHALLNFQHSGDLTSHNEYTKFHKFIANKHFDGSVTY